MGQLKLKTRGVGQSHDYSWFVSNGDIVDESWIRPYKIFQKDENTLNIFVEITDQDYRVSIDKILLNRVDFAGRRIYLKFLAEGKRGDHTSKQVYQLLKWRLFKDKELASKFETELSDEFVYDYYEHKDVSVVDKKIESIISGLDDIEVAKPDLVSEQNFFVFKNYDANEYMAELEMITNTGSVGNGTYALLICEKPISEKYFEQFNYRDPKYGRGLCFTTQPLNTTKKSIKRKIHYGENIIINKQYFSESEEINLEADNKFDLGYEFDYFTANGKKIEKMPFVLSELVEDPSQDIVFECISKKKIYTVKCSNGSEKRLTIDAQYSLPKGCEKGHEIVGYTINGEEVDKGCAQITIRDYVKTKDVETLDVKIQIRPRNYKICCIENSCKVSTTNASYGEKITVTVGAEVEAVEYNDSRCNKESESTFSFTMPDSDVDISVIKKEADKNQHPQVLVRKIEIMWGQVRKELEKKAKEKPVITLGVTLILILVILLILIYVRN